VARIRGEKIKLRVSRNRIDQLTKASAGETGGSSSGSSSGTSSGKGDEA